VRYAAGDRAGCPDRGRRSIIRRNTPGPALSGALAALWLLGSGCTALREIPRGEYGDQPERKDVRLVTREGLQYDFDYVRIDGDTLTGFRRRDVEGPVEEYGSMRVALDAVRSLEARRVDWVRTGLIGGSVAAGVTAAALARRGSDNAPGNSPGVKVPPP